MKSTKFCPLKKKKRVLIKKTIIQFVNFHINYFNIWGHIMLGCNLIVYRKRRNGILNFALISQPSEIMSRAKH